MLEILIQIVVSFAAGFLTLFFLFTSSVKITRWHQSLAAFQLGFMKKYGLNGTVYSLIGLAELLGALGLLLQGGHVLGTLAAGGLCMLCIGAFVYHLKFDSFQFGIPALITIALSAIVFFANLPLLSGLPGNLALSSDALHFTFSLASTLPAAIGAILAFNFARFMLGTATERMTDAASSDPYQS